MDIADEYTIKRFELSMVQDLEYLFKICFNQIKNTEEIIKKQNTDIYSGIKSIGYIAYHTLTKEPAAYYGVFPYWILYDGQKILAAQSGDTMTNPKHQGKGLFIKLAKMTYDLAKAQGVKFIFGFPNKNSYPGFSKRLDWKFNSHIHEYRVWVFTFPLSIFIYILNFAFFKKMYTKYIYWILSKYLVRNNFLFRSSALDEKTGAGILKNSDFFQYKSSTNSFIINLDKTLAWISIGKNLCIGDIENNSNEYQNLLMIKKIKRIAMLLGIPMIKFNFSPNSIWDELLKSKYTYKLSHPIGYLLLDSNSDLDLKRMAYSFGDFDTF